jgi:hypothetical protein
VPSASISGDCTSPRDSISSTLGSVVLQATQDPSSFGHTTDTVLPSNAGLSAAAWAT